MPHACWPADSSGAYWLDFVVGNQELRAIVDTGFIDRYQRIGFSVEPAIYDQLEQLGLFTHTFQNLRLDSSGHASRRDNGQTTVQLVCPKTRQRIGPVVSIYVARGAPMVPNHVGVSFFHLLKGCRVHWQLDQQEWCVEYP